jgi:hypothetical protein
MTAATACSSSIWSPTRRVAAALTTTTLFFSGKALCFLSSHLLLMFQQP